MRRRGRYCGKDELVPGFVFLLILACAWGLTAKGADANQPPTTEVDRALANVRECMLRPAASWPQACTQEYLDTIRQAIAANPDVPEYASGIRHK